MSDRTFYVPPGKDNSELSDVRVRLAEARARVEDMDEQIVLCRKALRSIENMDGTGSSKGRAELYRKRTAKAAELDELNKQRDVLAGELHATEEEEAQIVALSAPREPQVPREIAVEDQSAPLKVSEVPPARGGGRHPEAGGQSPAANFRRLVLGCIEAKFCK